MSLRAAELLAMYTVDEAPLTKSLGSIPGKVAKMAGVIGGGLALGSALSDSLDQSRLNSKLAAQLGASGKQSAQLGKIAGALYANNFGDSMSSVDDALKSVTQSGMLPEKATNAQIQSITGNVMNLASTFDVDLGGATNAVSQMLRTGLAKNAGEAMDVLTRGFQSGNDKAGDLLDTFNEYGTQFRKLGIDGTTAMGLISQGLKGGARDSDIVADSLKEFSIRAVDGSKLTSQSFKGLGLDAQALAEKIGHGGPAAKAALGEVLDRLRAVKDPAKQAQLAVGLFGTQAEDMGRALYTLNPGTAVQSMGQVAGAADRMGKTLNDNASTKLESFKRSAQQAFVQVLGGYAVPMISSAANLLTTGLGPAVSSVGTLVSGTIVPAIRDMAHWIDANQTPLTIVSAVIAAIFLPHLIAMGTQSLLSGAKVVSGFVMGKAEAIASAAVHSVQIARMIAGWLLMGTTAVAQGLRIAVVWTAQIIASSVAGAARFGVQVLRIVAGWVLMGVQSLLQAARMAAAWFIALGPVGWVTATVIGLVALIVANWSRVVGWTRSAWGAVTGAVSGAWRSVTGAVSAGVSTAVSFVRGLPGRSVAALGNLGSVLFNSGKNLVQGLLNGAGSLLANIGRFFLDKVPGWIRGPFEQAMGIHSPSLVFARYGQYIGQGLIIGIGSTGPQVTQAGRDLARFVTDGYGAQLTGSSAQVLAATKTLASKVTAATRQSNTARLTATRQSNADALKALRAHNAAELADRRRQVDRATSAASPSGRRAVAQRGADSITALREQQARAVAALQKANDSSLTAVRGQNSRASDLAARFAAQLSVADAKLVSIAKRRDALADELSAARDKLTAAIKLRDDYSTSVRDAARTYADLTTIKPSSGAVTSAQIVSELQSRLAAITTFQQNLKQLADSGLSKSAYAEIASAGVEAGGATAAALIAGGSQVIGQVNALQAGIDTATSTLGEQASTNLYQAGVDAAAGLVAGLSAKSDALAAAAKHLADTLSDAVRKALGIHSPSRVFAGFGTNIGEGLIVGMAGMRPAVASQMMRLADAQALSSLAVRAPSRGPAATSARSAADGGTAGGIGEVIHIDNYHEAPGSSPHSTAKALAIEARTGGLG